jgi:hypothetical protein
MNAHHPPGTKYRALQHLQPGHWWLGEYETADGSGTEEVWAEVSMVLQMENVVTKRKSTRVIGICTDGERAEIHHLRGHEVPSLTAAQGRKAGMVIADEAARSKRESED